ncbi:MAG: hypothetical protein ACFE0Q_17280 [Anaerolineae bacterium]
MKGLLGMLLLCGILALPLSAQEEENTPAPLPDINAPIEAQFSVDNEAPLLGEPFVVTLTVTAAADIEIIEWVTFDEPLEVINEGEIIVESLPDGDQQYQRDYELVLWDVGDYLSEDLLILYRREGTEQAVPIRSFYVQVPVQINNPEEATLRPPSAPIDLPYTSPLIYGAIGLVGMLIVMLLARVIQLSRRGMSRIVNASPAERAIAELEDLKLQKLPASVIYEQVANYLRQYVQIRFGIEAVEMTTLELIDLLRQERRLPKVNRQQLQAVLEQADLVKFAQFQPDATNSMRLINYAIRWMKEIERLTDDV